DKYCSRIADQFASQNLEIKPYDADNETFLISTDDFGDFLLPVPLDEAPSFKQEWDKWKSAAIASFVPNGEDVALKSVSIGKYKYDSDMDATYAQVDVEYNFKPVDVAQLNSRLDAGDDMAMNSGTGSSLSKGFQTEKIRISAGDTPDIDINIPKGSPATTPTFAVVIANGDYANASKVAHAENDGKIMTQYLTRTLGIPESNVATFINATYGQMASAISMLQDIGDAYSGSDFNLIFYYVGHGLPDDEGKKSYILPVDIDPRMVSICMPLEKIYADLGNLGAKNVTVMVDACFSGTNHGDGMLVPQSMGVAMKPKTASPVGNMVVLAAAEGTETAFPYEEKSHGLFTYWLLKKLQETSGNVTFGELSDYVIDNVKKTSVTVNRKPQTPTVATSPQIAASWRAMKFGN
ncbi:MAG: caspase family protein, partial [Muribaculaceae bacterium]|nr:caspase family protein [Muribaculaceae bacterium]